MDCLTLLYTVVIINEASVHHFQLLNDGDFHLFEGRAQQAELHNPLKLYYYAVIVNEFWEYPMVISQFSNV